MTTSAPNVDTTNAVAANTSNNSNNNTTNSTTIPNTTPPPPPVAAVTAATAATAAAATTNATTITTSTGINNNSNIMVALPLATIATSLLPTPPIAATTAAATATTRAMQSDEDFNIRFVNLVRTHKCLYDKKVPEYRNRDNQEKAWTLISQESRESVIHCKERWRNLRACLSRYIKQQNSSDPQHKPYYLTEHMSFLLPFLKSTRNSLDSDKFNNVNGVGHQITNPSAFNNNNNNNNNSNCSSTTANNLVKLFQLSQQQLQQSHHLVQPAIAGIQLLPKLQYDEQLEVKHSLSDNEDEETIDAFDPAITSTLQLAANANGQRNMTSTPLSDTASANSMQNFIPDVQLAELPTTDGSGGGGGGGGGGINGSICMTTPHGVHHMHRDSRDSRSPPEPKRIKTECIGSDSNNGALGQMPPCYNSSENADMEFFRSILPDIASLTPQQKRKFKIGILELIDDVVERYPIERCTTTTTTTTTTSSGLPPTIVPNGGCSSSTSSNNNNTSNNGRGRRGSTRDWRK